MKLLKEETERLTKLKDSQYTAYKNLRDHHKELKTVFSNVDKILRNNKIIHSEKKVSHCRTIKNFL